MFQSLNVQLGGPLPWDPMMHLAQDLAEGRIDGSRSDAAAIDSYRRELLFPEQ